MLQQLAAPRAELDELEEQLAKQLEQVRIERDERAAADRQLIHPMPSRPVGNEPNPARMWKFGSAG